MSSDNLSLLSQKPKLDVEYQMYLGHLSEAERNDVKDWVAPAGAKFTVTPNAKRV